MKGVILKQAMLTNTPLEHGQFDNADLQSAHLEASGLSHIDLSGA
jgi:uncharacterized protein YjbI with pentapeptide repeats